MKPKKFISILLLAFVAVSVIFLVRKERCGDTGSACASGCPTVLNSPEVIPVVLSDVNDANALLSEKLGVIYFHGNVRCMTCKAIESYSKEAIENGFADEIKGGRLEFTTINVDEPANQHYVQDYQLTTRSVVLVNYVGDKQVGWKNLDKVWQLVRDKQAFVLYVQNEAKAMMAGAN